MNTKNLWMVHQESDAHAHVMQNAIGQAGGDRQSESGMDESQRKDIAIPPKHLAKEQRTQKTQSRQQRTRNMRDGKQYGGRPDCPSPTEDSLQPHKKERLQDELLYQRPNCILPCSRPRHRVRQSPSPGKSSGKDDHHYKQPTEAEHHRNSCKGPMQSEFPSRETADKAERDHQQRCRQADHRVDAALQGPHPGHDQAKHEADFQRVHCDVAYTRRFPA